MRLPHLACLLVATVSAPAQAEFLLAPSTSAPPIAAAPEAAPRIVVPPRRPVPRLPAIQGFGEAVPLHVAARQVVPEGTSVIFADGVDRELPVNWQGGRPWNLVLADAIRPLGLKLARGQGQVTITR